MFQKVRVAAISFVPKKFELEANSDQLERMFRRAARRGAQVALGPEGILEGYVVNELITGEERSVRMNEVVVTIRGPEIKRFRNLAKELRMCLAFGCSGTNGPPGDEVCNILRADQVEILGSARDSHVSQVA